MRKRTGTTGEAPADAGLGGLFRGLGGFMDLLSRVAEEGGELHRNGELGDDRKGMKAVYGFSVRLGGAGAPKVEPFGNVRERPDGPVVEEVREPLVDVFDEGDYLTLVAELPGVEAQDVRVTVREDVLELNAAHGQHKYRKEVVLPAGVDDAKATSSYRNGVFELRLPKRA